MEKKQFPLDIKEFKERGVFISASPQHGKTNLGKLIADRLITQNFVIRAFDSSQQWLKSNIPYFLVFRSNDLKKRSKYPFDLSTTFDISRLRIEEQKELVRRVLEVDFSILSENTDIPFWICYILEEAQLYLPSGSLQATVNQEVLRMVSVGHNFNQTNKILTQRPADVSVKAIGRCGQLFIGKHFETNDIKRLATYLHWTPKKTYKNLTKLEKGEFYYVILGKEPVLISTPLFNQRVKPKQLEG